jgi:predicted acetyltransferase
MKNLNIELYRPQNFDILAELRRRQIEEERSALPVNSSAIRNQIAEWTTDGHQAFFLKWDDDIVGFAVIDTDCDPYSLKYFYASRNFRRSGMKVLDFSKLIALLDTDVLEVKVNARNTSSRLFWETFGFKEKAVCLRYNKTK